MLIALEEVHRRIAFAEPLTLNPRPLTTNPDINHKP